MVGWKSFCIIPRILPLCLKLLGGMAHEAREISKQAQALLPDEPLMAIIPGVTLSELWRTISLRKKRCGWCASAL
jgi:hypothetical protein